MNSTWKRPKYKVNKMSTKVPAYMGKFKYGQEKIPDKPLFIVIVHALLVY